MKKRLAIQPDYKKIQIDEIDNVISTLKNDFIPDEHANEISERLYNSLKNGNLNLSYCQISDEILNQIFPLLSVLNIKELNLRHNQIGPSGAKALAETLKTNTSLQEIYLSFNNFGDLSDRLLNSLENG